MINETEKGYIHVHQRERKRRRIYARKNEQKVLDTKPKFVVVVVTHPFEPS